MEFWRAHRRGFACLALLALLGPQVAEAAALGIDSVRSSPRSWTANSSASLPADVQAMEAATLSQLFDRDTTTEYTAFDDQSVDVALQGTHKVTAIRVFGAAPYQLTVQEQVNAGWRDIQGLKSLDLTQLSETWHSFETNNPVTTDKIRLVLQQAASASAGLKEVEIWSNGEHVPVETGSQLLALLEDRVMQDQALLATATPAEGTIGSISGQTLDDPTDNTFQLSLDVPASQIKYTWLVYETFGISHWANAVRVINDQPALGGVVVEGNDAWSEQLERISPLWLKQGTNRIRFTAPSENPYLYRVRNVRLIVEMDNGANFVNYIGASQTEDNAAIDSLYDGNRDTGMVVYSGTAVGASLSADGDETSLPPGLIDNPGRGLHLGWVKGNAPWKQALQSASGVSGQPTLEMGFDRGVELEAAGFYLSGKLAGKIDVELYHSGDWQPSGMPAISASALKTGWNDIAIADGNKVQGVRLVFSGGDGSGGEIRELSVRGSGIGGAWLPPEVVVTYPDAGQFHGREAYIRGFLQGLANDSGAAQLFVGGQPVNHVNGEFQTLVSKDDVGFESDADDTPWTVQVEAVYPDGTRATTTVPLFVNKGDLDGGGADVPPVNYIPVTPGAGANVVFEGAGISVEPGAVDENLQISMMPLGEMDLAALDTWMTNITGPHAGYRFLPHGKHFNKKIEVRIKYQPSLLPPGFSEDDIRTFYFDEQAGKWKELELKTIDKAKKEVVALTDHFTDMINAVIQVPDSPQNTQFNPTQIKDIKAADPGAKINLIEPPQANNMGDARLSYPIEVPPGRRGLQPQLAVQYNSGGGHGWTGQGWDIAMQSITIDTRWGVPRYDAAKETETYLLNGEQLTPLAHRGELQERTEEKVFHTRVEGAFQRIVRHGDSPKNYWWEVTDKNGTTYFYGGDDTTGGPVENATLVTAEGNIGKWSLKLVRDSNGNEMRYDCVRVRDSGLGDGSGGVAGYQLYLDKITYTGHRGQSGAYEVSFTRDREEDGFDPATDRRPDVNIDARLGFKQVTADLLKRIDVRYGGDLVRAYTFEYEQGAYAKTLLKKINQLDSEGAFFNAHTFAYYDEVRDSEGAYRPLPGEGQSWGVADDRLRSGLKVTKGASFADRASATSGTRSASSGRQVGVHFGANDGQQCKSNTLGGTRGSSKSETTGLLALVDINGDGLPDKVIKDKDSGKLLYRAGHKDGSFDDRARTNLPELRGLGRGEFYEDKSKSRSKGFEVVVGACKAGTQSADVTRTTTTQESRTYFSDVNGDGLVDLVKRGQVYFNRLVNGEHVFLATSEGTANPINPSAAIVTDGLLEQRPEEVFNQLKEENPLHDVVRVWEAPYDGIIAVDAPVSLDLTDADEQAAADRAAYEDADGVRVVIQLRGTELWSTTIAPDDGSVKLPENVASLQVSRGDHLYFRVQSVFDGMYDQVQWSPRIHYLNNSNDVLDANGKPVWIFDTSDDWLLTGFPGQSVTAPLSGTVRVAGDFTKPATTDDVRVWVIHKRKGQAPEIIWEHELASGEAETVPLDVTLNVEQEDTFAFKVEADTNIDWQALQWQPRLYYTAFTESDMEPLDENGQPRVVVEAVPDVRMFTRTIRPATAPVAVPETVRITVYKKNSETGQIEEEQQDVPVPEGGVVIAEATLDATFSAIDNFPVVYPSGPLLLTLKKVGPGGERELLLKKDMVVWPENGQVIDPDDIPPEDETGGAEDEEEPPPLPVLSFPVNPGEQYWFEFHSTDPAFARWAHTGEVSVRLHNHTAVARDIYGNWHNTAREITWKEKGLGPVQTGLYTLRNNIRFGPMYRQWGQFAWKGQGNWKGQGDKSELKLIESALNLDAKKSPPSRNGYVNLTDGEALESKFQSDGYDPAKDEFVLMFPRPQENRWLGYDDQTWIAAGTVSSSRLGEKNFQEPDPVADSIVGGSARAVAKLTKTTNTSYSLGGIASLNLPIVGASAGAGYTKGESRTLVDFLDMNGDRYPDIVGLSQIQYTTALGGLRDRAERPPNLSGVPQKSDNESVTLNFSVSPVVPKMEATTSSKTLNTIAANMPPSPGASGNVGKTADKESVGWMDVNGDGLPDRVYREGTVALNLGYGFTAPEPWQATTRKGESEQNGAGSSLGFNIGKLSISGGFSLTRADTQSLKQLFDVNGDGLPDLVDTQGGGSIKVSINTGNGFLDPVIWNGAGALSENSSTSANVNVSATYCAPVVPPIIVAKVCGSGSKYNGQSMSREDKSLKDIDGDGYPDFLVSEGEGHLRVKINTNGRTNLLKSVERPLGASFEIEYQREGNTYEMPQSKWVMSKVTVHDGFEGDGPDTQVTTFHYADGYHDRRERDFFGFKTVTIEERDTRVVEQPVYRSVTQTYHNASLYERGLLASTLMRDGNGNPYTETVKTYRFVNVDTQQPVSQAALPAQLTPTLFPQVAEEVSRFYEGQAQPGKATRVAYLAYDDVGNVTHFVDYGDSGTDDDVEARIAYFRDESAWIMGAAESIKVFGNGQVMRARTAEIEAGTGNVRAIIQSLGNGVARYDFTYDTYGNLQSVTGPANLNGERYSLTYSYDSQVHTHVTRIEDSFGYVSTARPNLKWGQVEESVDINNQKIRTTFDQVGRIATITGPYEQNGQPTITFAYHPQVSEGDALNWALTQHFDEEHPDDRIETALFTDGLKRVLQTKKDGTVGDGTGEPEDVMIVSGRVLFDHVGRSIEQYYPVTEPLGSAGSFNASFDPVPPTHTAHDVLDRPLTVTIPDGTATTFAYGFGSDRDGKTQFRTTVTDANGVKKDSFRDVRQLITAVKEYNQGQVLWTSYKYDPLKQITEVIDAGNNLTRAEYDLLGRRTVLDNPDTGKVEMVYDPAGNLTRKITPNLREKGQAIEYGYAFNRLEAITYPEFSGNNITYEYGPPNAPHNGANRIVKMTDQAGWETRQYGPFGELTQSTRSIKWAAGPEESYTTRYTYDTWNRLQELVYPDGEVLAYDYNTGGQMRAVHGAKGSYVYHYVQRLDHDKFEQRTYLLFGNNTESRYAYDPFNRRLAHLSAGKGAGNLFMDLSYSYDRVGNITALANAAPVASPNQMGGKTNYTYQYDDLYRLTGSTGTFDTQPDKQHAYTLSMQYDTIHNITQKTQLHTLRQPSGQKLTQQKTSYDWTYKYDGAQPHAPTHLGERTFSYDANGNQLGWTHDKNGTRRTITWDEENRIQRIQDNGHTFSYTYDGSGQRMTKRGPQGETGYINQWMTLRNGEVGTKHVFAGTTRVVSKLVKQDKPNSKRKGRIVYEKDQYYYHPDHLGTTAYITHTNGQVYQHLEYFPFGETWIEEHSNKQRTPYQFTAKELDEETNLYYFGARYYDPRTSVWQSPDPILDTYIGSDARELPSSGIFRSANLASYTYAYGNPLILQDPDGNRPLTEGEIKLARAVFGSSVDTSKVHIFGNPFSSKESVTLGFADTILMADDIGDFSQGTRGDKAHFIHEMTHIWQSQKGMFTTVRGLALHGAATIKGFFKGLFGGKTIKEAIGDERRSIYEFVGAKGDALGDFNMEQQASIVESDFSAKEKGSSGDQALITNKERKAQDILKNTSNFPE